MKRAVEIIDDYLSAINIGGVPPSMSATELLSELEEEGYLVIRDGNYSTAICDAMLKAAKRAARDFDQQDGLSGGDFLESVILAGISAAIRAGAERSVVKDFLTTQQGSASGKPTKSTRKKSLQVRASEGEAT